MGKKKSAAPRRGVVPGGPVDRYCRITGLAPADVAARIKKGDASMIGLLAADTVYAELHAIREFIDGLEMSDYFDTPPKR